MHQRVQDSLPLYEILNQFQKGHSHMAVVVKSKQDIKGSTANATAVNGMFQININANSEKGNLVLSRLLKFSLVEQKEPYVYILVFDIM